MRSPKAEQKQRSHREDDEAHGEPPVNLELELAA